LALGTIYDGARRTEAAKIGGVTLQIIRDWVLKFNAHGPDGLIDRKVPGQPPRLNDAHRAALAATLESGPVAAVHGVVRWRIVDLCQWPCHENLSLAARILAGGFSSCRGSGSPRPEGMVSEDAERAAGCEMALDVEGVLDGGVNGQEALG
jgi:hypothetical protein